MKKGQTTIEYAILMLIVAVLCVLISAMWNRTAIIQGATFGVEGDDNTVHVRPMTD